MFDANTKTGVVLQTTGLRREYRLGRDIVTALGGTDGLSFNQYRNECVCICVCVYVCVCVCVCVGVHVCV